MKRAPSKSESLTGLAILLLLSSLAIGIFFKQFQYDASLFAVLSSEENPAVPSSSNFAGTDALDLSAVMPRGMVPLTPVEIFGPDTLSDKIDGKAELYLSAGFSKLQSQRFALEGRPEAWVEVFIYNMGSPRNAFAVYSTQRRADGKDLEGTDFAYGTQNALFLAHGKFYVEMVGSAPQEALSRAMAAWGQNILRKDGGDIGGLTEEKAFPQENFEAGSLTLLSSDVFGFEGLNNVFTARYLLEGTSVGAFISLRETPEEAQSLAAAYHAFLLRNGGIDVTSSCNVPDCQVVQVFDTMEIFFSHGPFLAGVHEAENASLGAEMALRLYRRLLEVVP